MFDKKVLRAPAKVLGTAMRPFHVVSVPLFIFIAGVLRILPRRVSLRLLPFAEELGLASLDHTQPVFVRLTMLGGSVIELDLAEKTQRSIYSHPVYEHGLAKFFQSIVKEDDVVLDVGANVGYYTLLAASKGAQVYAFEPDSVNYKRLSHNVALNAYKVTALREAVGGKEGTATLHINPLNRGGNTLMPEAQYRAGARTLSRQEVEQLYYEPLEQQVPMTTIDAVVSKFGIGRVRVLKIDVEGFESEVFEGMKKALDDRSIHYIICELSRENRTAIMGRMASHGYVCKGITDTGVFTEPSSRDVIFIRG